MKVKSEYIEKNLIRLEIESDAETVEAGLAYSFKKNAKNYRVNGFRPGKAPRAIIEAAYGKEVFYDDAVNYAVGTDYSKALEELKLDVVSEPQKIDVKEFSPEGASFTIEVYTKPEVKLGQYKDIEVKRVSSDVTDEDVDNAVKAEAEKNSRLVTVEGRAAEMGDTAVIDFEGFIDGEAFEGGKGEAFSLKLGSGQFIPGFEEQLVGAVQDEEKTVTVTFPEDYHAPEYAGKQAEFKVKVSEIKTQELPEIDDDFAADISEFETLAEYKADLKNKMTERRQKEAQSAMDDEALRKAIEAAEIDVPECMIDESVERELKRMEQQISMYGMTLEQYVTYQGISLDEMKKNIRPQAEIYVRRDLVLEAVAAAENIEATQEEIDEEFKKAAEYLKKSFEEVKTMYAGNTEAIVADIKMHKASDIVTGSAVPTDNVAEANSKGDATTATTDKKKAPAKKATTRKPKGEAAAKSADKADKADKKAKDESAEAAESSESSESPKEE